jgi:hypothetical protein
MDYRQALLADLPPPRDDEPAGLRQDILDELNDHLACSYRRELLRGVDAGEAGTHVLKRFGDPAAVARRLWFDAMKEKIMLQRALVTTCLIVMLLCVGFVGFAWVQMNRARAAVELARARAEDEAALARARMAQVLADNQATNKAMLGQIDKISDALRHPRSPDWNPVRLKLVAGRADGPPVARAMAHLERFGQPSITRVSDAAGVLDFGSVQPGDYQYQLVVGREGGTEYGSGEINVQPGSETQHTIICPKTPPARVLVSVHCQLPPELEARNVVILAKFVQQSWQSEAGVTWRTEIAVSQEQQKANPGSPETGGRSGSKGRAQSWVGPPSRAILWGPGPERASTEDLSGLYFWTLLGLGAIQQVQDHCLGVLIEIRASDLDVRPDSKQMEVGSYVLSKLIALRPVQSGDVPDGHQRCEVLGLCSRPGWETESVNFLAKAPTKDFDWTRPTPPEGFANLQGLMIAPAYWMDTVFEARLGQANEWTVSLPDGLVEVVRNRLAEDLPSQSKRAVEKPKSKP